jgi:release factor glutamine methyltransferase
MNAPDTGSILDYVEDKLSGAGIENSRMEAGWIIEEILGCSLTQIIAWTHPAPTGSQMARIDEFISKRSAGQPIQHILGYTYFYGRKFLVKPGILVPRPETEILASRALEYLRSIEESAPRILDLYTGSGNILLTALIECPQATGVGVDIDPAAISCAEENSSRFDLQSSTFMLTDIRKYLAGTTERFNLITANPPYVSTADIPGLMPEVKDHENHLSLDGGTDGMDQYRFLEANTHRNLKENGALIFELDPSLSPDLRALFSNWSTCQVYSDYSGSDRIMLVKP